MELSALEVAVIGFGLIGATVAGKAAHNVVLRNHGSEHEALAAGCVTAGLSAAVLPAAAVGGLCITGKAAYDYVRSDRAKLAVATARAQTLATMDKVVNGTKSPSTKRKAAAA